MMQVSQRIKAVVGDGSDGWEIYYKTRDLIASGVKVVNLTIGEHDVRTDRAILDEMHTSAVAGNTGYAVGPGKRALREAIAARAEALTGVPTNWKNVMVTPGGQAALFASHMVLLDGGEVALYCDPFYATYPGTIAATGARPEVVKLRAETGFQPEEAVILQAARSHGAKTLLLNSPNNPTGVIHTRAALEGVTRAVKAADLWLISDEVYDSQIWAGEHLSARALPGMSERTLVVGSMSKGHAMTGSRLGWVIGPEVVIEMLASLALHTTYGVPGFIQDAALFALRQGAAFEARIGAPFRRRRDIVLDALAGQNRLKAVPPDGAMYVMLDVRATGLSGQDFAFRLLDAEKIAVMPGESFGTAAAGHIRIALTTGDDEIRKAMSRLIAFAENL
jgi:arginine:pyruvate transaminase